MSGGTQLFVYPEELDATTPEALVDDVAALGCDAISLALVYHRGRRVLPRQRRVSVLPRTTFYFEPDRGRYPAGTPAPSVERELVPRVAALREACRARSLAFRAWIVPLHDEQLAAAFPDATAETVDGSTTAFALCPSATYTAEYLGAVVADLCAQLEPDAVDLEGALFAAWEPAYTITLALEPVAPHAAPYLAQCFCAACRRRLGGGWAELRERVVHAADGSADPGLDDELAAFRSGVVAELIAAAAEGTELCVTANANAPRLRGLAPAAVGAADRVLLGLARLSGDELDAQLAALLPLAGDRPVTVSLNWTPERTPPLCAHDAARVRRAGAERLALYNLSLVPESALAGFAAAARVFAA